MVNRNAVKRFISNRWITMRSLINDLLIAKNRVAGRLESIKVMSTPKLVVDLWPIRWASGSKRSMKAPKMAIKPPSISCLWIALPAIIKIGKRKTPCKFVKVYACPWIVLSEPHTLEVYQITWRMDAQIVRATKWRWYVLGPRFFSMSKSEKLVLTDWLLRSVFWETERRISEFRTAGSTS